MWVGEEVQEVLYEVRGVEMMDETMLGSRAYLIRVDINTAEERRESFQDAMSGADHSADVCVSFNGTELEFTLNEFGKLLGFDDAEDGN